MPLPNNSVYGNYGIARLVDQQTRFLRPGGGGDYAALRVKNFNDQGQAYSQLGFTYVPSASGGVVGYTDVRIDPPPVVRLVSMHNLAMAVQSGIALRQGARIVMVSNTFVAQRALQLGFQADPKQVFEDPTVIGIVVNGLIVSIESVVVDYTYGESATWHILGNAADVPVNA